MQGNVRQGKARQLLKDCDSGDFDSVRSLVSGGTSVDFQDEEGDDGSTPVINCCSSGQPKILQFLLEQGADADVADGVGWTALHYASGNNKPECMTVLLRHGVVVNAVTMNGETSLWMASMKGNLPTVELLVQAGADIEKADIFGKIPLDKAREEEHAEVVKYLDTESKWRRRRAWAMVFCSIKNVDSDAKMMRVMQNRDLAGVIASYL